MKTLNVSLASLLAALVAGCAPHFGLTMKVPPIPQAQHVEPEGADAAALQVKVGAFEDARLSTTIAEVDNREIPSAGSAGAEVQEGFERYFKDVGVRIVRRDAPILEGEISEWSSKVLPGFPSSDAEAKAKIRVTVKEATVSHPLLDEEHVRELLGQAMAAAIEAAVTDEMLRSQLSRGRIE
jgi:hypothetical protein